MLAKAYARYDIRSQPATKGRRLLASTFPPAYDLRTYNRVTPVRNQGAYNTCWAFSVLGSFESRILTKESLQVDLSENNVVTMNGRTKAFNDFGNVYQALAYLLRWDGPGLESEDGYPNANARLNLKPCRRLTDYIMLPPRSSAADNSRIKQAVMDYGAVRVSYYADNDKYLNTANSNGAYYYPGGEGGTVNHAVCIIGWDDNYSASNFKSGCQPPGNGAFIIKNSWGTAHGLNGYTYVSYHDDLLARLEGAYVITDYIGGDDNNADILFQHDRLGFCQTVSLGSSSIDVANIFVAAEECEVYAVGFYANSPGLTYYAAVLTEFAGTDLEGAKQNGLVTGTMEYAGYHTINLSSPLRLSRGERFAVEVALVEPDGEAVDFAAEGPADSSIPATASPGESLYFADSRWKDLTSESGFSQFNFCVKAVARQSVEPPQNDDFENAILLPGASGSTTGSNINATNDQLSPYEYAVGGWSSVWWKWVAPIDCDICFDTGGSDFSNCLGVFTGSLANPQNWKEGSSEENYRSVVAFRATAGTEYYVFVSGFGSETGRIKLNWGSPNRIFPDLQFAPRDAMWPRGVFLSPSSPPNGTEITSYSDNATVYAMVNITNVTGVTSYGTLSIRHEILDVAQNVVATWDTTHGNAAAHTSWSSASLLSNVCPSLPYGQYTYRCRIDPDGVVGEYFTDNNVLERSFAKTAPDYLAAPSGVAAVVMSMGSSLRVSLSWLPVSGATGYRIYRSTTNVLPGIDEVHGTISASGGASENYQDDMGLEDGMTYYYWIRATAGNVVGSPSSSCTAKMPGGGSEDMFALSASVVANGIQLSWPVVSDARQYTIYRSTTSDRAAAVQVVYHRSSKLGTTFLDETAVLTPGTTYYYWVEAIALQGTIGFSKCSVVYVPSGDESPDLGYGWLEGWPQSVFLSAEVDSLQAVSSFEVGTSIYLNMGVANFGDAPIATPFVIRFELRNSSGVLVGSQSEQMSPVYDWQGGVTFTDCDLDLLQGLPVGSYELRVRLDSAEEIAEEDESDNEFTYTFEIAAVGEVKYADLHFYEPSDVYSRIFFNGTSNRDGAVHVIDVSQAAGCYIHYVYLNDGDLNIRTHHQAGFEIEDIYGNVVRRFTDGGSAELTAGYYIRDWMPVDLSGLAEGCYKMTVRLDDNDNIRESDETNNSETTAITIRNSANAPSLNDALCVGNVRFYTNDGSLVFAETWESADGVSAVQLGPCDHGSSVSLMSETFEGPGELTFSWRASSEKRYDLLTFHVDDTAVLTNSGTTVGWTTETVRIGSGSHTVKWRYSKDNIYDRGFDCGWVDCVSWIPAGSQKPGAPTLRSFSGNADGISVGFDMPLNAAGYNIYRATVANPPDQPCHSSPASGSSVTFRDESVTPGVDHYYWMSAFDGAGVESDLVYCGKEYRRVLLDVSCDEYSFDAYAYTMSCEIESNASEWSAQPSHPWIIASKLASGLLELSVLANSDTEDRDGCITIIAGSQTPHPATNIVQIFQSGNPNGGHTSPPEPPNPQPSAELFFGLGEVSHFTIPDVGEATLVGISNVTWGCFSETDYFGTKVFSDDRIVDAEKTAGSTMKDDDTWCYPLSDMNALFWTGWAQAKSSYASVDDMANRFRANPASLRTWGGYDYGPVEGAIGYDGIFGWFQNETGCDLSASMTSGPIDNKFASSIRGLLDGGGHVIRMAVAFSSTQNPKWSWLNNYGGVSHGVLCVGYVADPSKAASDPTSLKALFVVDPDNDQSTGLGGASAPNTIAYCPVTWNGATYSISGIWGETSEIWPVSDTEGYRALANFRISEPVDFSSALGPGAASFAFDTSGDAEWFVDETESADGDGKAVRSGAIGNGGTTWLETQVSGSGRLSFWYKVSCISVHSLSITIDGVEEKFSGNVDWTEYVKEFTGSGTHTIRWTYTKASYGWDDGSADAAWIDELRFGPTVTVTFDPTVGTMTGERTVQKVVGTAFGTLPRPESATMTFDYWRDGDGARYSAETVVPDHDVALTAEWKDKEWEVRFDGGIADSGNPPEVQTGLPGAEIVLPGPGTLAKAGYEFIGWSDGTTIRTNGATYVVGAADVTMTAQWSLSVNGVGEALGNTELTYSAGGDAAWYAQSDVVLPSGSDAQAVRSGAIGNGGTTWLETQVSGSGRLSFWYKVSCISVHSLSITIDGVEEKFSGNVDWTEYVKEFTGSGTHTIRWTYTKASYGWDDGSADAAWIDELRFGPTVTVTFDPTVGTMTGERTVQKVVGTAFGTLPRPESATMTFDYWRDGDGARYSAETVVPDHDVALTAEWKDKEWEVRFDGGIADSGNPPEVQTGLPGAEIVLPGPGTLAKAGYEFIGWSDGAVLYVPGGRYGIGASNVTLTAQWSYAVTGYAGALDSDAPVYTAGGNSAWYVDSEVYDASVPGNASSLRSGVVPFSSGVTWCQAQVSGAGSLSFRWKISALSYGNCHFKVTVDGAEVLSQDGGVTDWQESEAVRLGDGVHVVRWTYSTDWGWDDASVQNCAWIDSLVWTPDVQPGTKAAVIAAVTEPAAGMTLEETRQAVSDQIDLIVAAGASESNAVAWIEENKFAGADVATAKAIDVSYGVGAETLFANDPVGVITAMAAATPADGHAAAYGLAFQLRDGADGQAVTVAATEAAKAYVVTLVKATTDLGDWTKTPDTLIEATYDKKTQNVSVTVSLRDMHPSVFLKVGN